MTSLREAATQALEALEDMLGWQSLAPQTIQESAKGRAYALRAALAEPVQEPVAWLLQSELDDLLTCNHRRLGADSPRIWAPFDISSPSPDMGLVAVYTAPPQRKPLTEEEIDNIWGSEKAFADIYAIARAIERAHGIV